MNYNQATLYAATGKILMLPDWHGLEYLIIRLLRLKDSQNDCYRDVSFEEEAYMNEDNLQYLEG